MAAIFRRPQFFEKSGVACFSKNLASCIQFLIECRLVSELSREGRGGGGGFGLWKNWKGTFCLYLFWSCYMLIIKKYACILYSLGFSNACRLSAMNIRRVFFVAAGERRD
jgi:hypothetical protein